MSAVVASNVLPTNDSAAAPVDPTASVASSSSSSLSSSSASSAASSSSAPGVGGATQPYASASLYVGDLNNDVTEALLFEIFNAVGPVASVRVCRDAATRRSLGYAYVNFHRLEDAERALDTLNFKMIRNRACRIMWSHRDPALRRSGVGNIFVNHLAKDIDNKQLYDTFSVFGNILSCKVATNSKRESLGYGFVHYETDESANAAITRVDGKVINGEKVSVVRFVSKKERPSAQTKNKYTNVFVKNLPLDVTVTKLEELFRQFGTITSSTVNIPAEKDDKTRAFGFLNFETAEQAAAAVDGGNNIEIGGKKLFVGRAQKKEERQKELTERFENLKMERQAKYAGVNLFVKNLSEDIDDERLTAEFSKFGGITSATVMKDPATNKSRGFGFVCFSTPEEATKAVTDMNGKMLENKPLYVALAQRKEQRRAQLEQQYAARQKLAQVNGMMPIQAMNYPGVNPMMFSQQQLLLQQQRNQNYGMPYPQQLLQNNAIRYPPPQQMQMMPNRGQINYQLMPAQPGMNGGGRPMLGMNGAGQRQAGPRNFNGMQQGQQGQQGARGGQAPQGVNMGGAQPGMNGGGIRAISQTAAGGKPGQVNALPGQSQNIRYNENVRNQGQVVQQRGAQQQGMAPVQTPASSASDALTAASLASAPEELRKQMIGERLFPLVRAVESNLAGKITGMLLEMDNGELLHLLESREALNEKIQEALTVLHQHSAEDDEQQ